MESEEESDRELYTCVHMAIPSHTTDDMEDRNQNGNSGAEREGERGREGEKERERER